MGAGDAIHFFVDEHLPDRRVRAILAGHRITRVEIQAEDPEILYTAEQASAVVLAGDRGFLRRLYQFPWGHPRCFRNAGVVQLPGEWDKAEQRLIAYLPVVEAIYRLSRTRPDDHRIGIDLSKPLIHIHDPWT